MIFPKWVFFRSHWKQPLCFLIPSAIGDSPGLIPVSQAEVEMRSRKKEKI